MPAPKLYSVRVINQEHPDRVGHYHVLAQNPDDAEAAAEADANQHVEGRWKFDRDSTVLWENADADRKAISYPLDATGLAV